MPVSARLPLRTLVPAAIILVGLGFGLVLNLPGHLSYDSIVQLWEGRRGIYLNWHPPVMSFLLGLADAVVRGTTLFVVLEAALLYGSLLAVLALRPTPSWAATAVAGICVVTPQFLLYPSIVWKDVLFAGATISGFVSIAHAALHWGRPRCRLAFLAAATLLISLAALTRQNGLVMALAASVAVGFIAATQAAGRRLPSGLAYGVAVLAGAIVVFAAGHAALATRVVGVSSPATQFRLLQTYDIAGMLSHEPKLSLDPIDDDDLELSRALRGEAARLYTPERNDTLASATRLQRALQNADDGEIPAQWVALVIGHPWLYLRVRADAFRWLLLPPQAMACHPYYVGVSGPPGEMRDLGLSTRFDARDQWLKDYAERFVGTPIFSHPTYLLLALVEIVLLVRRRAPPDIAIAALLVGSLAFTATFFVISIACDYRYLYVLDASALAVLFYLALDGRRSFA